MKHTAFVLATFAGLAGGGCTSANKIASLEAQLKQDQEEVAKVKAEEAASVETLTKANRQLSTELQDEVKNGQVRISQLENRLTVSVVEEVLFASGSTALREPGKAVLEKVTKALKNTKDRDIMVEGHTDNTPIGRPIIAKYPTNWELSTARATTVVRFLQSKGINPAELGAAGFGQYRSVASNDTAQGRQKNRRIDVVLTPKLAEKRTEISAVSRE